MPKPDTDFDLLISGGTVVTESESVVADVGIRNGCVTAVGNLRDCVSQEHINADGLIVMPGGIDVHVHMSLPFGGTVSSDDFKSGSLAAAFGGTTTMIDFAAQVPGKSLPEAVQCRRHEADKRVYIDYSLHLILTDVADRWMEQLPDALSAGVSSFKAFTAYPNEGLMLSRSELRKLMIHAAHVGAQVDVHAEDGVLIEANREALVASGHTSMASHPKSRSAATEVSAIGEVLETAGETGCDVHIHHLSTAGGLKHIEENAGGNLSAETCPQYLLLDDSLYESPHAELYAVSPPLRSCENPVALWTALRNGIVGMVATDHCPFTLSQKMKEGTPFTNVPNGMPGIETRLPIMFSEAVVKRGFTLSEFVRIISTNAAHRFRMYPRKGTIMPGSDADLVLLDPQAEVRIEHTKLHMNCDWSPFEGLLVTGWPVTTLLRGNVICQDGELIGAEAIGQFIRR